MIITTPAPESAEGHVAAMYAGDIETDGFVYAHRRAMAVNPEAHAAFEDLIHAIVPSIGARTYELVTLAAAGAIGSAHCLLAHGRHALRTGVIDEEELVRLARDPDDAGLSPADLAVMHYAARLSTDAGEMTDADSQALRDVGFTDRQIVDITLAAAARNYFSRALLALSVDVDDVPGLTGRVTDALLSPLTR
ncbi:carboxymuconolactone decarboxylase family protein [uncultured Microbacterium sp.]|uniref:Uncharacterized peroxidase-related enzyme n=1 Tax=uncultured Microbacterium sp. TaxID=191216 RepID=A0A1Y5NV12_9MICO|nr:carboxymuconolactone decarboxylase family protein [uncultured Microbacterium sp.]SBS70234.1 putative uncharacterized peroxidase-related enzyme [uncultured Microbacterium sp.]